MIRSSSLQRIHCTLSAHAVHGYQHVIKYTQEYNHGPPTDAASDGDTLLTVIVLCHESRIVMQLF